MSPVRPFGTRSMANPNAANALLPQLRQSVFTYSRLECAETSSLHSVGVQIARGAGSTFFYVVKSPHLNNTTTPQQLVDSPKKVPQLITRFKPKRL